MNPKLIIRHLSGSKTSQTGEFLLADLKELSIGRDEGADIQFDPDQDDLVSRKHASIHFEGGDVFRIRDEGSRNGTFINKERISGTSALSHGDIVQLGPGGPEFRLELDPPPKKEPPPKSAPPPTRDYTTYRRQQASKPTRVADAAKASSVSEDSKRSGSYRSKGRFTLLQDSFNAYKQKSLRTQINIAAGLLGVFILVIGLLVYFNEKSNQNLQKTVEGIEQETTALMSPQEIGAHYSDSVVLIEADWKLIHRETNKQVYHRRVGNGRYPAYLDIDGQIIPWLTTDDESKTNITIGGFDQGTGFSVTRYGAILTNRHVAASSTSKWEKLENNYGFEECFIFKVRDDSIPEKRLLTVDTTGSYSGWKDKVDDQNIYGKRIKGQRIFQEFENLEWVPAQEKYLTEELSGKFYVIEELGQFISDDRLNVYFPNDPNPIPGRLARKSIAHDVALISIDAANTSLPFVTLEESDEEPDIGELITILGYPAVSLPSVGYTKTVNPFDSKPTANPIYNPSLTTGYMGKRVAPQTQAYDSSIKYTWALGDVYQLTANATGAGNSGGPVFNSKGRVVGIFFARAEYGGARITFAVPIKYGKDLIDGYKAKVD